MGDAPGREREACDDGDGESTLTAAAGGWTLLRAMRHGAFWALFSVYLFTGMAMFSVVAQVVAYLVAAGFTPSLESSLGPSSSF